MRPRVIFSDADLLVVDKPAFVPSQSAEVGGEDDLVSRLKAHLRETTGEAAPYLGVHQRLDQATSGVILFVRRREANAAIAKQFEGRAVRKTYLAVVTTRAKAPGKVRGAPLGPQWQTHEHHLLAADGRARVVPKATRGAQRALMRARVLERVGPRALVEVELQTGRMHQARAQLAHLGAPIAGDAVYGGVAAARLMLHAHELVVLHPTTGRRAVFTAPRPPELVSFLAEGALGERIYGQPDAVERALEAARERRYALATSAHTSAYRMVNEGGDALPGVAIDVYGGYAVVQLYGREGPWAEATALDALLDRVFAMGMRGVYLKVWEL